MLRHATCVAQPCEPMIEARTSQSGLMLEAAFRAMAYCLHPRVIYLSFLPLIVAAVTLAALGYVGWASGVAGVRTLLDSWDLSHVMLQWMDRAGMGTLRAMLAPLLLLMLTVPIVIIVCLLLVGALMTPALVKLVKGRRFQDLRAMQSTPWWRSLAWSLGSAAAALGLLLVSLPLWLMPLLAVVLPPLIWGWLTYRVLAYDTLVDLASPVERHELLKTHKRTLLLMGVVCGYLGAAPTALWALGAMTLIFAPILMIATVWIYTLVFAFSSLWFAHYLLPALHAQRQRTGGVRPVEELA
jgi:hypothetical protein